jgi:hypothetical protein
MRDFHFAIFASLVAFVSTFAGCFFCATVGMGRRVGGSRDRCQECREGDLMPGPWRLKLHLMA